MMGKLGVAGRVAQPSDRGRRRQTPAAAGRFALIGPAAPSMILLILEILTERRAKEGI
jgi:hypothetical protein